MHKLNQIHRLTCPSVNSDLLIDPVSLTASAPELPVALRRSLPAKSTRTSLPCLHASVKHTACCQTHAYARGHVLSSYVCKVPNGSRLCTFCVHVFVCVCVCVSVCVCVCACVSPSHTSLRSLFFPLPFFLTIKVKRHQTVAATRVLVQRMCTCVSVYERLRHGLEG